MKKLFIAVALMFFACEKNDLANQTTQQQEATQPVVSVELEESDYQPPSGIEISDKELDNGSLTAKSIKDKYFDAIYHSASGGSIQDKFRNMYDIAHYIWGEAFDPIWMKQNHPKYDDPHHFDVYVESFIHDLKAYGLYTECVERNLEKLKDSNGNWNISYGNPPDGKAAYALNDTGTSCNDGWNNFGYGYSQIIVDKDWYTNQSDTSYDWETTEITTSATAGKFFRRWDLLYHELGHAVLGWKHPQISHARDSGEPKIMKSTPRFKHAPEFFIRRAKLFRYYMEQRLFTPKTPYLEQMSVWWKYSNRQNGAVFPVFKVGSFRYMYYSVTTESTPANYGGDFKWMHFTPDFELRPGYQVDRVEWFVQIKGKWYKYSGGFTSLIEGTKFVFPLTLVAESTNTLLYDKPHAVRIYVNDTEYVDSGIMYGKYGYVTPYK